MLIEYVYGYSYANRMAPEFLAAEFHAGLVFESLEYGRGKRDVLNPPQPQAGHRLLQRYDLLARAEGGGVDRL